MTIATITHDVNGIRININGTIHTWANQSWLAESHAQMLIRVELLDAKLKDIGDITRNSNIEADDAFAKITKILESQ